MSHIDDRLVTAGSNGETVWRERPKPNPKCDEILAKLRTARREADLALECIYDDLTPTMSAEACVHVQSVISLMEQIGVLLSTKIEVG